MKNRILAIFLSFLVVSVYGQSDTKEFILALEKYYVQQEGTFDESKFELKNTQEKKLILDVFKNIRIRNEFSRIEALINLTDESASFDDYTKAWANYNLAATISDFNLLPEAELFTKKAIYYSKKLNDKSLMFLSYRNLAGLYFTVQEYEKAYSKFNTCLTFKDYLRTSELASTYNNLGLCQVKMHNYNKALSLYEKGMALVQDAQNSASQEVYYLIRGNRGTLYNMIGKVNEAYTDLKQELDFYTRNDMIHSNYFSTLSDLFEIDKRFFNNRSDYFSVFFKNYQSIKQYKLKHSIITQFVEKNEDILTQDQRILILKEAFKAAQVHDSMMRQNQSNIMSLLYSDKLKNLNSTKLRMEKEISSEATNNRVKSILILLCLISIAIMIFFLMKIKKQKETQLKQAKFIQEQQEELYQANQRILTNEIKAKKEELNHLNLNLRIKKETEENYLGLIKKFRRNKNIPIEEVINELQLQIKNLREIDRKMDLSLVGVSDKNADLNAKLLDRFPQLSNQEIAYCNYFLLNLSSKEIGQITGQNPGAVRVFKNKIKNKLGLEKDQNLNAFLKELNLDNTNT